MISLEDVQEHQFLHLHQKNNQMNCNLLQLHYLSHHLLYIFQLSLLKEKFENTLVTSIAFSKAELIEVP